MTTEPKKPRRRANRTEPPAAPLIPPKLAWFTEEWKRLVPRGPVATFVGFPAGTVRWLGTEPKRYRSSKDVERSFCAECGSSTGFHRIHETSLCLGSFDAPSELPVARG